MQLKLKPMARSSSGEASLLLLTALPALFATAAAARPQPSLQSSAAARELAKALGVSGYGDEGRRTLLRCMCECDLIWLPKKGYCTCGGVFDGSCPAACKRCFCIAGLCYCLERVKYKDCMMSLCPFYAFPAAAQATIDQKQEN